MKVSSVITHVAAIALFSITVLLIYATVQQTYRTAANDPQMQFARDIANSIRLNRTYKPFTNSTLDLSTSLSTIVQVYDGRYHLVSSDGYINGKAPAIPKGVLKNAKQYGENTVTWQPGASIRLASVVAYTGNEQAAYVVVARSLQEVEIREGNLVKTILLFWIAGCSIIIVHWLIQRFMIKR